MVDKFEYELEKDDSESPSIGMERNAKSKYEVKTKFIDLKRNQGRAWYPRSTVRFYGFPDEVVAYHKNADFVQELNLQHEKLFHSISYLGPLRNKA